MLILEIGLKLDKLLVYYHNMLLKNGIALDFSCITYDIYYTDTDI